MISSAPAALRDPQGGPLVRAIVIAALALQAFIERRNTKTIELHLNANAPDVTVNGKALNIPWYAVSRAIDPEGAYAIERRVDDATPISIPKRVLPLADDSLLTYLEDRITNSSRPKSIAAREPLPVTASSP